MRLFTSKSMTQPSLARRKPTRPKCPTFDSLLLDTNEAVLVEQEKSQKQAVLLSTPTSDTDTYSYSTISETERTHSIPITFSRNPMFSYSPIPRRYPAQSSSKNASYSPSSNSSLPYLTRSISTSTIETASCCSTPGTIGTESEDRDCHAITDDQSGQTQKSQHEDQENINNSSVESNNNSQQRVLHSYVSFPSLDYLADDCWLDVKIEKERESIACDLELERYDEMVVGGIKFEY